LGRGQGEEKDFMRSERVFQDGHKPNSLDCSKEN
jgi:hypothetical protein